MKPARILAVLAILAIGLAAYLLVRQTGFDPAPVHGAEVKRLTVDSRAVGEPMTTTIVVPPDVRERPPLLLFLHGRGGDERSYLDDEEMFIALDTLGPRAPVVAFPDGGDHSYWHDRGDGAWGRYVNTEVLPAVLRETGADPMRVAIGGISMGGFGSYDLARLHPGRFCAVGGHSPALWEEAGETPEGAFDDAEDFARHDVIGAARSDPGPFTGQPVWMDTGDEDPFLAADRAFADAVRAAGGEIESHVYEGGHDGGYWNQHWDEYFRFYAAALAHCT